MAEAVAPGVFEETGDGARIIAGRSRSDGTLRFPMPSGPDAALYEPVKLGPVGRLWSFTVQRFRPKTPPYIGQGDEHAFRPYAVGYVEFPGELIVEGRIVTDDFDRLSIGQPMRVGVETFPTSTRGNLATYAFYPISEG